MEGMDPLAPSRRKERDNISELRKHVELLLEGVIDDGCQYLDDELITACYHAPPEWIPLMKRIDVVAEYVRAPVQGDVVMDDDYDTSEEEEDS